MVNVDTQTATVGTNEIPTHLKPVESTDMDDETADGPMASVGREVQKITAASEEGTEFAHTKSKNTCIA